MNNESARVLAGIDREVWVITSQTKDGRRGGLLATWVQQVSLDEARPALLIALHPDHYTRELIDASGAFIAHLLRDDQSALAYRFVKGSGRLNDKMANLALEPTSKGASRLRECLGWSECEVFSRLVTGDRVYFWANCIAGGLESTATPLRETKFFKSLSLEERSILQKSRRSDIDAVQAKTEKWRAQLPDILRFSPTE